MTHRVLRFLALLLAVVCRDEGRVELTVATVSNPDMRIMQRLSGAFEADHPGIRLRWVVLPENDLRTRVTSDLAVGAGSYGESSMTFYNRALFREAGLEMPPQPTAGLGDRHHDLGVDPLHDAHPAGGLQSLPEEQLEAARIDGARPLTLLRFIVLPHLTRYIEIAVVLEVLFVLSLFGEIFVATSGGPGIATTNLTYQIYRGAFERWNIGRASAVGVIAILLANLILLLFVRVLRRGRAEAVA